MPNSEPLSKKFPVHLVLQDQELPWGQLPPEHPVHPVGPVHPTALADLAVLAVPLNPKVELRHSIHQHLLYQNYQSKLRQQHATTINYFQLERSMTSHLKYHLRFLQKKYKWRHQKVYRWEQQHYVYKYKLLQYYNHYYHLYRPHPYRHLVKQVRFQHQLNSQHPLQQHQLYKHEFLMNYTVWRSEL